MSWIEDPGTVAYWVFKIVANGFVAVVWASIALTFLRALGRGR